MLRNRLYLRDNEQPKSPKNFAAAKRSQNKDAMVANRYV